MGGSVMDTFKGLIGKETSAEKSAKAQQSAALASAKAEADTALDIRKKRMEKKMVGKGSLLSGNELGVQPDALKSTLG